MVISMSFPLILICCFYFIFSLVSASSSDSSSSSSSDSEQDQKSRPRVFFKNVKITPSSDKFSFEPSAIIDVKRPEDSSKTSISRIEHRHSIKPSLYLRRVEIPSTRHSPIITQLNILDNLFKYKFTELTTPATLMTIHLNVLKIRCLELARQLGPLHHQARTCAIRLNELRLFLNLLTKYKTDLAETTTTIPRRTQNFCTHLQITLRDLRYLVDQAFYKTKSLEKNVNDDIFTGLKEFEYEIKTLYNFIESIDMNLNIYCGAGHFNSVSLKQAKDVINQFLQLAFI